jgi:hypothetical protein
VSNRSSTLSVRCAPFGVRIRPSGLRPAAGPLDCCQARFIRSSTSFPLQRTTGEGRSIRLRPSSSPRVSGPFCASTASPLTWGFACPATFRPRPFPDPRRLPPRSTSWPCFMPQAPMGFPPFRAFPSPGSRTASPRPLPSCRSTSTRARRQTGASKSTPSPPKCARRRRFGFNQRAGCRLGDRLPRHPKMTGENPWPPSRPCSPW